MRLILFGVLLSLTIAGCATTQSQPKYIDMGMPVFAKTVQGEDGNTKPELQTRSDIRLLFDENGFVRWAAVKDNGSTEGK